MVDEAQGRRPQHDVPWRAGPPLTFPGGPPPGRRRSWGQRVTAACTVGVIGLLSWGVWSGRVGVGVDDDVSSWVATDRPTPGHEVAPQPLGVPAPVVQPSSSYRYIVSDPVSGVPARYDPCRPVHYVVRAAGAPAQGGQLVAEALAAVSVATGLHFVSDGATDEAPSRQRAPYQPDRYGDRWAPVLIAWVTPAENPEVAADVVGQAGSVPLTSSDGRTVYVTGQVELDAPQVTQMLQQPGGYELVGAMIRHELGHLVGLDHVADPTQLMYPQSSAAAVQYGAGDLTGLAELGRGACVPDL